MELDTCPAHSQPNVFCCKSRDCQEPLPFCTHPDHLPRHYHGGALKVISLNRLKEIIRGSGELSQAELQSQISRVRSFFRNLMKMLEESASKAEAELVVQIKKISTSGGEFSQEVFGTISKLKENLRCGVAEIIDLSCVAQKLKSLTVEDKRRCIQSKISRLQNSLTFCGQIESEFRAMSFFKGRDIKLGSGVMLPEVKLQKLKFADMKFKVHKAGKLKELDFFDILLLEDSKKPMLRWKLWKDGKVVGKGEVNCRREKALKLTHLAVILQQGEYIFSLMCTTNLTLRPKQAGGKVWQVVEGMQLFSSLLIQ